jgi:hypothetical protein
LLADAAREAIEFDNPNVRGGRQDASSDGIDDDVFW